MESGQYSLNISLVLDYKVEDEISMTLSVVDVSVEEEEVQDQEVSTEDEIDNDESDDA